MKIHLGCGKRFIPGFIHIDIIDYPHIDHVCSIDNLSMLPDNSVDLIYNCHVLEHFKRKEVVKVILEWKRVLKTGGTLRTAVPDFESICELYTKEKKIESVIGPVMGGQTYLYNVHYNIFDFRSFKQILEECGFNDVHRYEWQSTEHSDVDDYSQAYYPHMDKQNGLLLSLNVECIK